MSKHLRRALDQLRIDLLGQFADVEQMVQLSVRSLVERRRDIADQVIEADTKIDMTDIRIEEECLKLLALHQPVAEDLRWVVTVIKVNDELERMADLACNIAERAKSLDLYPLFPVPDELSSMVTNALEMVRDSVDAFVQGNAVRATEVIKQDEQVDEQNRIVIDLLEDLMLEDKDYIIPAMHCFSAARLLEQIADIAESLAEEVIYMSEGEIVRHQHGDIQLPRSKRQKSSSPMDSEDPNEY
ncbi:phosphate signaling complex protein PhoU [Crateriforma spongiae]|uniref:phosphate signaling complex protein PhoU n=1 Tax=Crateriforma spongiae TaxID=2724528 RepID=UPI001446D0FA|nr:phosphate signaling complex protein PhoU [Crateriforma spongiae]